jgi:hypothetical protein
LSTGQDNVIADCVFVRNNHDPQALSIFVRC